jgi:hypothetical protein
MMFWHPTAKSGSNVIKLVVAIVKPQQEGGMKHWKLHPFCTLSYSPPVPPRVFKPIWSTLCWQRLFYSL